MPNLFSKFSIAGALFLAAGAARAADLPAIDFVQPTVTAARSPFFVHFGPAGIFLGESASINLGGAPLPGASVHVEPHLTVALEAGYYVTPNIAVSVTGGYPPTVDFMGKGLIAGLGRLGTATYGPGTLTAHYHFNEFGRLRPYIGGGPTFMVVFGTFDGAMANVKLNPAIGFAAQVGAEYMLNDNWGLFIDFKKAYLRTTATGQIAGLPVRAKVTLDPLVIHTGIAHQF